MGAYADETSEFSRSDDEKEDRPPLGERLRGRADELDVDSVEEVRELRERA